MSAEWSYSRPDEHFARPLRGDVCVIIGPGRVRIEFAPADWPDVRALLSDALPTWLVSAINCDAEFLRTFNGRARDADPA